MNNDMITVSDGYFVIHGSYADFIDRQGVRMGKKKTLDDYPKYKRAINLRNQLQSLNKEIQIIDEAIMEMQIEKLNAEYKYGEKTTPFWQRWFGFYRRKKDGNCCLDQNRYDKPAISLCEAELLLIKGFKQGRVDEINKEIQELSKEINED